MYEFANGPLVWVAFASVLIGFPVRLFRMRHQGLGSSEGQPNALSMWLAGWISQRIEKGLGDFCLTALFYMLLIATPLLLVSHRILWMDAWGVAWPSLHAGRTHGMGLMVLALGGALLLGRFAAMKTRPIKIGDCLRWLVLLAPFATGWIASAQIAEASVLLPLHIFTGAIWLAALPYTALADRTLFMLRRDYRFLPPGDFQSEKIW